MRHYYTIKEYHSDEDSFLLEDNSDGQECYSYLWELDIPKEQLPSLVGKQISVSYLKPLIYDAINPKVEENY